MAYTYIISQEIVNQLTQSPTIVSGYLLGHFEGEYVIIDTFTLENPKGDIHVRPKYWAVIKKTRIHTLRQLKDTRERHKEQEAEATYIRDHEQQCINDYVSQNRAVINAKQAVKEMALQFAKGKGVSYRVAYHFHTHPDTSTSLTDVDLAILKYIGSSIEIIITPSVVIGYSIVPTDVRPKYRIDEMPFQISD